jgi:hypothetical protein
MAPDRAKTMIFFDSFIEDPLFFPVTLEAKQKYFIL